jgi:hypothetical protein
MAIFNFWDPIVVGKIEKAEVFPKVFFSQKFKIFQSFSGASNLQSLNGFVFTGPFLTTIASYFEKY